MLLESLRLLLATENFMLKLKLTGREGFCFPYTAYSLLLAMSQHGLRTSGVEHSKYLKAISLFGNPYFFNFSLMNVVSVSSSAEKAQLT